MSRKPFDAQVLTAREGEMLDALVWRHYGRLDVLPLVIEANRQLARLPVVRLPLKSGVLSFVQNVDKELRNGGKASTCGIHAGI